VARGEGIAGGAAPGGCNEAGGGTAVAAVVVAGSTFSRAAGGFRAASSAMTGSGVMTVVGRARWRCSEELLRFASPTAIRFGGFTRAYQCDKSIRVPFLNAHPGPPPSVPPLLPSTR
jgi:hypothetical protein